MAGAVNRRDLAFKALAGLVGGALGWLPVEAVTHGHTLTQVPSEAEVIGTFVAMALLAALIGGFVLASEGQSFELTPRMRRHFLQGFIVCLILSPIATYYSDAAFSSIILSGGWGPGHPGSEFSLFIGRVVGWSLMGLILGLGVGIASLSLRNVLKGALGGLVGGFIGGVLFDPINLLTGGGLPSRIIGFSVLGLAIGLFIGLVYELTKSAWVTIEAGRLKGRQYRVEQSRAGIGRAEENLIGLFGDPAVAPVHARIERSGNTYRLVSQAVAQGTFLNGQRVESAELKDGDRIKIGGYELAFHTRAAAGERAGALEVARGAVGAPRPAAPAPSYVPPAAPSAADPGASDAQVRGFLIDAAGARHALRPGAATRIGRALDNDVIVQHASVSRHHASIAPIDGHFELRDEGSQNGCYVGGRRVTQARIQNGDALRFGDAEFTFHA